VSGRTGSAVRSLGRDVGLPRGVSLERGLSLLGALALLASYVSVLYHVADVVGASWSVLALTAGMLALATLLGRHLSARGAVAVAVALFAGGFTVYLLSVPTSRLALLTAERVLGDTLALLTGMSVLRLTNADVWALALLPAPVFLTWYFALRRRPVASVVAGGLILGLFVLTTDAGTSTTLVGVGGAAVAVGFGALEKWGTTAAQRQTLLTVIATMVVLSASVSVVPGGGATPLTPGGPSTVEASLVDAGDNLGVVGSISLSPEVRFSVESDRPRYWQTASYDRYTGQGWVRTGQLQQYEGDLEGPPGPTRQLQQRVTARTPLDALPAAWRPVEVRGSITGALQVSEQGTVRPAATVQEGERYTVVSRTPLYTTEQLRTAGTDYPEAVTERYLGLPDSTPERVSDRTDRVVEEAGADTPYAVATAVETHLETEKSYSLAIDRPDGSIADSFLFEMESGYCVYYATTMVTMLRSQGVPARFVVGYTSGERVADDEFVVRGFDSHAWVQVYFPGTGWVNFDPTPASDRERAEQYRLAQARSRGVSGIDVESTMNQRGETPTPIGDVNASGAAVNTPDVEGGLNDSTSTQSNASGDQLNDGPAPGADGTTATDRSWAPEPPSRDTLAVWLVAAVGAVAGSRRLGLDRRAYDAVRLRYQGRADGPEATVVRAHERLETLLGRQYRPRRADETERAYLAALDRTRVLDERVEEAFDLHERARYGDGVTAAEAERAVALVDGLVRAETPILRRFA
jgi:transglutaminase-like putative cysteine protease